ncbi:MAG: RlpA-like double-psi beta-barrel domain-containing protein [Collinsella bouchesdurhonensis]|uniref:septal ring lytic transglycosylase RlpA family protein n=1 Tax=Collinsella bouchesdurhonensis TaxID=1907654 RepID=UPI00058CC61F|nr:septal ring lytic transglycosylase RlpA family protein [Collinsella bouchesdurhonensis]MEE0278758.1 RlpA-like double-psi beta-barrel domain-containing protein [Collinsella bouchesdurhonensis]
MYVNSATSTSRKSGFARIACVAGLTAVLVGGSCLGVAPCSAYAATAQTETELAALTQQVNSAATTYQQATDRVNELNEQISEMADEILDFEQNKLPEQQQKASDAAANLYKLHVASPNVMSMLLNSASLGDLITQGKYLTTIQDDNTAELERLNAMHEELEAKMEELSSAKDEAEQEQQKASEALASAQSAQAQMAARAQSEDAAEAEAARKAAEEAAATTAQMQQQGSVSNSNGSSQGSNAGSAGSAGSGSSTQQPSGTGGSSSGTTSTSSWKSGVASYYGIGDGFMGGTTASGAIVTESSMGVAMLNVPLGTYVEISYGGRSVIAVVNDRGPYVHGRVIDMQPAVARALGFLSVGVGTVQYRFL